MPHTLDMEPIELLPATLLRLQAWENTFPPMAGELPFCPAGGTLEVKTLLTHCHTIMLILGCRNSGLNVNATRTWIDFAHSFWEVTEAAWERINLQHMSQGVFVYFAFAYVFLAMSAAFLYRSHYEHMALWGVSQKIQLSLLIAKGDRYKTQKEARM